MVNFFRVLYFVLQLLFFSNHFYNFSLNLLIHLIELRLLFYNKHYYLYRFSSKVLINLLCVVLFLVSFMGWFMFYRDFLSLSCSISVFFYLYFIEV